jgi:cytochrome P450
MIPTPRKFVSTEKGYAMSKIAKIEYELNPFPIYAQMRQSDPVYFDPRRQNYNIFRFEDVQRALSEYATFSSQFTGSQDDNAGEPFSASMISTDPPKHRKLRTLVSQAFTPRAVEALAPRIQAIVNELLDDVSETGQMDAIEHLGYPLPVIVIAELLGVPGEDRAKFKEWSDIVVSLADLGSEMDYEAFNNVAVMEMSAYFFNMIEQRRVEPSDDLISGLLQAEVDNEQLSMIELLGFCALLLVAGNETTTNLIGNALLTFIENPGTWERLRQQPDLLPSAIEEVLRYRSPVQSMFRVTKQEATLAGTTIPAGQPLVAWIGSANHDENQFPQPENFDIERKPNKHLAFGHGIHYCLGAPLARLEASIALGSMLERFSSIQLAPNAELERIPSILIYGLRGLPIKFS